MMHLNGSADLSWPRHYDHGCTLLAVLLDWLQGYSRIAKCRRIFTPTSDGWRELFFLLP